MTTNIPFCTFQPVISFSSYKTEEVRNANTFVWNDNGNLTAKQGDLYTKWFFPNVGTIDLMYVKCELHPWYYLMLRTKNEDNTFLYSRKYDMTLRM